MTDLRLGQEAAMPVVSAVVLAGGKSQRLGMDKSLLRFEGEWLLERILKQLATLSNDLLGPGNKNGVTGALAIDPPGPWFFWASER